MRRALLALLALASLLAVALPVAGEGGKILLLNGYPTEEAQQLDKAIAVNATGNLTLEFRVSAWPGPDATAARARVGILLADDVEVEVRSAPTTAAFRQGEASALKVEVPLDGLSHLGSGAFWVHASLLDATGQELFSETFLVKVADASFLTVEGVLTASLSLVLAYGVWRLVRDVLTLLGFIPTAKKKQKAGQDADRAKAEARPSTFLQALRESPSILRIAGLALSLAVITVMWSHALGLVPLGQDLIDAFVGKAENALLVGGIGYAAFVGVQGWRLRRRASADAAAPLKDS